MQQPFILEPDKIRLDPEVLASELKIQGNDRLVQDLLALVADAESIGRPKSIVLPVSIERAGERSVFLNGVEFESRLLEINLKESSMGFAVVATAGRELDWWVKSNDDILYHFWADHLAGRILQNVADYTEMQIKQKFNLGILSWMLPGSLDIWPIEQQKKLFNLFKGSTDAIGVTLTDNLILQPLKSISGLVYSSSQKFFNCQLCRKEGCLRRRAVYDEHLARDTYGILDNRHEARSDG